MSLLTREEYIVAGVRHLIELLEILSQEMETGSIDPEALNWRLRAVEIQSRRLREAA